MGMLKSWCQPWLLLIFLAITHIPRTVVGLCREGKYGTFFSPSAFSDALFGHVWVTVGPGAKEDFEHQVTPLLQGRVKDGQVQDEIVDTPLHGVVMEVGAGSGMWVDVLAKVANQSDSSDTGLRKRAIAGAKSAGVTKIFGVEPHPVSAKALAKRVQEVGLGDIYEVVPVGIEDVNNPSAWSGSIEPESLDSIVTICCLCSIPDPEKNIKLLYKLLKPGGKWYVHEHVASFEGGAFLRLYQRFVNIPWSFVMGGCTTCRPTKDSLLAAGAWSSVDLAKPFDQPWYEFLPVIMGTLTK